MMTDTHSNQLSKRAETALDFKTSLDSIVDFSWNRAYMFFSVILLYFWESGCRYYLIQSQPRSRSRNPLSLAA